MSEWTTRIMGGRRIRVLDDEYPAPPTCDECGESDCPHARDRDDECVNIPTPDEDEDTEP